jgi:CRP/FNR family cyclic AMP-dependent transcriptional regulator
MTSLPGSGPVGKVGDHPFLAGFPHAFVERLGRHARPVAVAAGELLIREGTPADAFYLVQEGKLALEVAAADLPHRTIQTIGPGEVLGWSWLLPPHQWRLDARAVKATRVWAVDAAALRDALNAHPEDGYRFVLRLLPVIAERLENTRIQLLDLHGR